MPPLNSRKRDRCAIENCDRPWHCRDWCKLHYERHRRYGDPFHNPGHKTPARDFLAAHVDHVGTECLIWPFARNGDGYAVVGKDGRATPAAREMCEMAHGAPPTPDHEGAHSCGKGHEGCINPMHLTWKTHQQNMDDQLLHGTRPRGERAGNATLTDDQARQVKAIGRSLLQREIAAMFGVSPNAISSILRGRTWRHI